MADQTVVYELEIKLCNLEDKYWRRIEITSVSTCLLYTSDAADD